MHPTLPPLIGLILALLCPFMNAAEPSARKLTDEGYAALRGGRSDEAVALFDRAITAEPNDANPHLGRAHALVARKDLPGALQSLDRVVAIAPNFPGGYQTRGETRFKAGRMAEAIADFDQVIRLAPDREPHHWQRGIAHYYAGRFADGKRQFEIHQTVNKEDVENAVWHFLCNARLNGVEQARRELIPISRDSRVPMKEVHDLFAGKGSEEKVLAAAETAGKTDAERRGPRFYAHLYLGIFAEALGDTKAARTHIEKAAKDFAEPHYMGDVARVHWQLMNEKPKAK